MSAENPPRKPTKEEIIAAIKACAERLGHAPSQAELKKAIDLGPKAIQRHFGNYTKALRACGLEPEGIGYQLSMEKLFMEWARVVREVGELPSMAEYTLRTKYSEGPLRRRFKLWKHVPTEMLRYAQENGLEEQWADVLEIVKNDLRGGGKAGCTSRRTSACPSRPRILTDRPVYGAPLMGTALGFAPVNEMGVVYLFGVMASKLGFMVTWIGTEFPDSEAIREVEPGRWQRVRVEFEYESRNFLRHLHNATECDLIVCWEHTWPECPLEVVELKGHFGEATARPV